MGFVVLHRPMSQVEANWLPRPGGAWGADRLHEQAPNVSVPAAQRCSSLKASLGPAAGLVLLPVTTCSSLTREPTIILAFIDGLEHERVGWWHRAARQVRLRLRARCFGSPQDGSGVNRRRAARKQTHGRKIHRICLSKAASSGESTCPASPPDCQVSVVAPASSTASVTAWRVERSYHEKSTSPSFMDN